MRKMELFILIWYFCTCIGLIGTTVARNITAIIIRRSDYDGVDVSLRSGYIGELATHKVAGSCDVFTKVALSPHDIKLEYISPTKVIEIYRLLGNQFVFRVLNRQYAETTDVVLSKYLYYTVADGALRRCILSYYYRMIVPFYNPCKHIELTRPSCYFNKTVTEAGDILCDIVGTIYAAQISVRSKLVWYNRVSSTNRLVKIRSYSIHYIPFIDIVFETPDDSMFTMTFIWYMDEWIGFKDLRERFNFMYQHKGGAQPVSPLRFVARRGERFGKSINLEAVLQQSPIKITVDIESETESELVTIENYKDRYGDICIYTCSVVCVFEEAFFEGARIFPPEEHSPYMISLQQGLQHNVVYTLTIKPEDVELREYVHIDEKWTLQTMTDPPRYFYLVVLDTNKEPDKRLYNRKYVKDGRTYMQVYIPKKFIGFTAVLVEENGTMISRSIDSVIFCEVRIRENYRQYIYYDGDSKMMFKDKYEPRHGWKRGDTPLLFYD